MLQRGMRQQQPEEQQQQEGQGSPFLFSPAVFL
jgi:hypothetical protein